MTTTFEEIVHAVFDRGAERRIDDPAAERDTIERAQVGDEDATVALVFAYAPTLRRLAARHAARLGSEEARSVAVSGLIEAIHAFRLDEVEHDRLGGLASRYVAERLGEEDTSLLTVPARTRKRFFSILANATADGLTNDEIHDRARLLAPSYEMTSETYDAIRQALVDNRAAEIRANGDEHGEENLLHVDTATPIWAPEDSDAFKDAEDKILADKALSAVEGREHKVSVYAYGFATGEPLGDGEVAQEISVDELGREAVGAGQSTLSRSSAQRFRTSALRKMRKAVGAQPLA